MKKAYEFIRSAVLWALSLLHFGAFAIILLALSLIFHHRRLDPLIKIYFRNIQFLSGMRVQYVHAPGYDQRRTTLFISNHVNLFDPFVLYNGIAQVARGLELESHFQIPFYGWLMRRFGNVPIPDKRSPAALKRTLRLTQESFDAGISLVIFPEGHRTRDGGVDKFEEGAFMLAQKFKVPVVPVSIVGSFQHNTKDSWMLRPARITVYFHDTIDTCNLTRADLPALSDRVWDIVARPVHEHLKQLGAEGSQALPGDAQA
jgi:1-acyl-sn-glycerol-3-phosphate acyltransferase